MKAKRTVYLVVDYGGEWEDKWDSPYMAFDNEHDARYAPRSDASATGTTEKNGLRHFGTSTASPMSYRSQCSWMYQPSRPAKTSTTKANAAHVPTASSAPLADAGSRIARYYVKGTWNFCPKCRRRVVAK